MTTFILRFDDFTRYSDLVRWKKITDFLKEEKVPALIAVTPDCKDEKLAKKEPMSDVTFWSNVKSLREFDIGMHGLHHENFGLMTRGQQEIWMMDSMRVFMKNHVIPYTFIPPNHSYNRFTLESMKCVGLEYLSDGIGIYPWRDNDTEMIIVPQILWTPRKIPIGVITFCMHPDTMSESEVTNLFEFVKNNKNDIISITDVETPIYGLLNLPFAVIYKWFYGRNKMLKRR